MGWIGLRGLGTRWANVSRGSQLWWSVMTGEVSLPVLERRGKACASSLWEGLGPSTARSLTSRGYAAGASVKVARVRGEATEQRGQIDQLAGHEMYDFTLALDSAVHREQIRGEQRPVSRTGTSLSTGMRRSTPRSLLPPAGRAGAVRRGGERAGARSARRRDTPRARDGTALRAPLRRPR